MLDALAGYLVMCAAPFREAPGWQDERSHSKLPTKTATATRYKSAMRTRCAFDRLLGDESADFEESTGAGVCAERGNGVMGGRTPELIELGNAPDTPPE